MKGNLKKVFRYKTFYVMLVIILIFLPTTLYMPSQAQSRAIVTAIGIDKVDDLYEVTLAMITPKNGGQVAGGNMVDSGTGDSVSIAMQNLSINLGKVIGLQHCSFIIISDAVFQEDVTGVLDYFIRSNNLTADAHLINCPKSAKALITEGASASTTSIATMNDIVQFNNDYLYSEAVTIYEFYNRYLSPSGSVFVPILELEGEENKKDSTDISQKSSGESKQSSSNDSQGGSSNTDSSNDSDNETTSGGKNESTGKAGNSSRLKSNGKCAIVKKGVKLREISEEERIALNVINEGKGNSVIPIYNFSEGGIHDADMYYQLVEKNSSIKGYFKDGKPTIKFTIRLLVKLDEIRMHGVDTEGVSALTSYMSPRVENNLKSNLNKYILDLTDNLKKDNADILFVYDNLNRFHNREFKEFLDTIDSEEYMRHIEFETDIEIRSKI